ncbi:MAG: hypothetical protein RLT05_20125 [Bauldia litoralis]
MARHGETFAVSTSVPRLANACRMMLPSHGWKLMHDNGWAFLIKERLDLVGMMMSYPVKFAIFLREDGDDPSTTNVELKGATFGFGPIPKGKLRKKSLELRALIEGSAKQRMSEPTD